MQNSLAVKFAKNALNKWRSRTHITKKVRHAHKTVSATHKASVIRSVFSAWKERIDNHKRLFRGVSKIFKTYDDLSKSYAFNQIKHFGDSRVARKSERKNHAASDLAFLLNAVHKNRLRDSLYDLKIKSIKAKHDRTL